MIGAGEQAPALPTTRVLAPPVPTPRLALAGPTPIVAPIAGATETPQSVLPPKTAAIEPKPASGGSSSDLSDLVALWARVARQAGGSNPLLRTALINARLTQMDEDRAVISCPARFCTAAAKGVTEIGAALAGVAGRPIQVVVESVDAIEGPAPASGTAESVGETVAAIGGPPNAAPARAFNAATALEDPVVQAALRAFEARVVDVQPRRR